MTQRNIMIDHMIQRCALIGLIITLTTIPSQAHAYIGAALTAGGAIMLGLLILSLLLAVYVLVWFPVRRKIRESREANVKDQADQSDPASDEPHGD